MYPITRPMLLIQPVSLLLRNRRRAGRPHARGLDDYLTVLRPYEVGRLRRFGVERACGIRLLRRHAFH
jgi:hypothetical protein